MNRDDQRGLRLLALTYLEQHQVMTVATDGPLGLWAAAVFYVNDGFDLYFLSAGHTRHGRNLAVNPLAAATIQEDYDDWPEIKGIQLEGTVEVLGADERSAAIALYHAKYPFIAKGNGALQSALAKVNWYKLKPNLLYFIDNSKGLGHRDQIHIEPNHGG